MSQANEIATIKEYISLIKKGSLSLETKQHFLEVFEKSLVAKMEIQAKYESTCITFNEGGLTIKVQNPLILGDTDIPSDVTLKMADLVIHTHKMVIFSTFPMLKKLIMASADSDVISIEPINFNPVIFLQILILAYQQKSESYIDKYLRQPELLFKTLEYFECDLVPVAKKMVSLTVYFIHREKHNNSGNWSFGPNFESVKKAIRKYNIKVDIPYSSY